MYTESPDQLVWLGGTACRLDSGRFGFHPRFPCRALSKSSHTSDLEIDTPVATLLGSALGPVGQVTGGNSM